MKSFTVELHADARAAAPVWFAIGSMLLAILAAASWGLGPYFLPASLYEEGRQFERQAMGAFIGVVALIAFCKYFASRGRRHWLTIESSGIRHVERLRSGIQREAIVETDRMKWVAIRGNTILILDTAPYLLWRIQLDELGIDGDAIDRLKEFIRLHWNPILFCSDKQDHDKEFIDNLKQAWNTTLVRDFVTSAVIRKYARVRRTGFIPPPPSP